MRKLIGIIILGLLITTIFPVGATSIKDTSEEKEIMNNIKILSQLEITIQGGLCVNVIIKNVGTTDIENGKLTMVLDGSMIFKGYKNREVTFCLESGKTARHVFPVFGLGATNIEVTIGNIIQTKSGKIFGPIVFGVK